jgi:hypothetical protein
MKLNEYLQSVSPDTMVRLDNGEGSIYFYGAAGEITDGRGNKYLNFEVKEHCFGKYGHDILYISIV